jgi:hypothetical protein
LKAGTATTVFVNWGGAHTGNRTDFAVDLLNGTVSDITLASGEFYEVESAPNGFYRIMYSSTLTSTTYFPQISPIASTGTIIFGGIQIERNPHATPFTSSSRSTTEGLLDLTGNSSIDLSNVSFDSNAQMTFDGTDDYATFTHSSGQEPLNSVTFESMVKLTSTSNYKGMFMKSDYGNPNGYIAVHTVGDGYMRLECSDTLGSVRYLDTGSIGTNTRFIPNETVYFTLTYDGTNIKTYINSVLKDTYTWTHGLGNNQGNLQLGRFWAGSWSGDIYQFKQYNQVLTPTEITNNYLKYKRQYGLT